MTLRVNTSLPVSPSAANSRNRIEHFKRKYQSPRAIKDEKVICGYCRRIHLLETFDTNFLIELLFSYFHSPPFIFNAKNTRLFIGICSFFGQHKVTMTAASIALIDCIVSLSIRDIFEWEVQMTEGDIGYIGFVDASKYKCPQTFTTYPYSTQTHLRPRQQKVRAFNDFHNEYGQYAMKILMECGTHVFRFSPASNFGKPIRIPFQKSASNAEHFTHSAVFRFRVNFFQRICDIFVDDILYFREFFRNIPTHISPAVSSPGNLVSFTVQEKY